MKVLFVVSGIGYGDAIREHCNILEFKKQFPQAKIMVAGYDRSYDYFKDKFDTIKIRGYKLPGSSMKINVFSFGFRNLFLPAYWFLSTFKVRLEAFNFIPDLIISDFEPAGISLARLLNKKCIVVFGYDPLLYKEYVKKHKVSFKMKVEASYFEKLYQQADLVLIPTFRKSEKHLLYHYVDPIVRVKPEDLASEEKLMKELKLKKKPILLMLGGSNFGLKLVKHLNKVAKNYNEEFIIFGGDVDLDLAKNVKYIKFTEDFLKYLKICKGVITLAGQKTLSEALVYQKPILCYPIKDHIEQTLNAYALEGKAMVSYDNSEQMFDKNLKKFIEEIPLLTIKTQKNKVSGDGSKEIIKIISAVLK